jgi:hypothetical protein
MNTYLKNIALGLGSFLLVACGQNSMTQTVETAGLTAHEKHLCDSMKIDPSVLLELKKHTSEPVEAFHYSLSKMYNADQSVTEIDPIRLPGFVFREDQANTSKIITELQSILMEKGYYLFIMEQNFGLGQKDAMAILKTTDQYEVLRAIKTDGINYGITTDSLIAIVKNLDKKYALSLVSAGGDFCEFRIGKDPADWMDLAREAYAVCPDIVDQGTESVEALADELKKRKSLYFWWD